jgi:hypothetical protein
VLRAIALRCEWPTPVCPGHLCPQVMELLSQLEAADGEPDDRLGTALWSSKRHHIERPGEALPTHFQLIPLHLAALDYPLPHATIMVAHCTLLRLGQVSSLQPRCQLTSGPDIAWDRLSCGGDRHRNMGAYRSVLSPAPGVGCHRMTSLSCRRGALALRPGPLESGRGHRTSLSRSPNSIPPQRELLRGHHKGQMMRDVR